MPLYISPFKLFNLPVDATDEVLTANKERYQRVMQHHPTDEIVQIGSTKLSKQRVLHLLKELDNFYTRQYHVAIYEHKKLLNFMEYGHLGYFKNDPNFNRPVDSEFLNFIAPYFGYQYGETFLQAIKTQDKETLELLSKASLPMVGDFEEKCYQDANAYVQHTLKMLKDLQQKEELPHMSERELVSYLPNRTIELYNMLPDYFYTVRNLIGNEIYALSNLLTYDLNRGDGAFVMLRQGLKLKLDDTVRQNLEAMLEKFSFKSKVPSFIWIGLAVVAVLFMMKYIENLFFTS